MNNIAKLLIIFLIGIGCGVIFYDDLHPITLQLLNKALSNRQEDKVENIHKLSSAKINLCFTPPANCGRLIAQEINGAKSSIYMQAYGLTHPDITKALIKAKGRGVDVRIIVDRSNLTQKHSKIKDLRQAGIEVLIDIVPGIAHNKVVILDRQKIVSGSFNFTTSADKRNTENVLIIDDVQIAERYLQNWLYRKEANNVKIFRKQ